MGYEYIGNRDNSDFTINMFMDSIAFFSFTKSLGSKRSCRYFRLIISLIESLLLTTLRVPYPPSSSIFPFLDLFTRVYLLIDISPEIPLQHVWNIPLLVILLWQLIEESHFMPCVPRWHAIININISLTCVSFLHIISCFYNYHRQIYTTSYFGSIWNKLTVIMLSMDRPYFNFKVLEKFS